MFSPSIWLGGFRWKTWKIWKSDFHDGSFSLASMGSNETNEYHLPKSSRYLHISPAVSLQLFCTNKNNNDPTQHTAHNIVPQTWRYFPSRKPYFQVQKLLVLGRGKHWNFIEHTRKTASCSTGFPSKDAWDLGLTVSGRRMTSAWMFRIMAEKTVVVLLIFFRVLYFLKMYGPMLGQKWWTFLEKGMISILKND